MFAIISPEQLIAAEPDRVFLTLPDLNEQVRQTYPQLDGRWTVDPGSRADNRFLQSRHH
jgi:hypothetical protein